jgi:two-component system cell cycle sensor histidine kinase/response regulator CckA
MSVVTQFPALPDYNDDPRYRATFEGAGIGIAICRLDGRILEANPALSRMLGYTPQELADSHAGDLYPELDSDPHSKLGRQPYSADSSSDQQLLEALMRGERDSFEVEKRYQRKNGSELWGCLTVSLARDARRQPVFLIATLADAAERKRVEEHLREAGKMEVIGRLAGGIAHDFNNLLTGILLYCDLLSAGLDGEALVDTDLTETDLKDADLPNHDLGNRALPRSELSQHVHRVRMAGEQGAALTHQLLAIARKQAAEPRPTLINEIVASTENLLRHLIGERLELVVALDSAVGPVLTDPAQLRQILMNLVLNARDAMPQSGKIWVITRSAEFPCTELPAQSPREVPGESHSNFTPIFARNSEPEGSRRAVSLMVKDNGCGMNAETRARLFEPFFTTKNPGKGTGLGMATVQRIVAEAGGKIAVESEEGRGTCIEVFFPAIVPSSIVPSARASQAP